MVVTLGKRRVLHRSLACYQISPRHQPFSSTLLTLDTRKWRLSLVRWEAIDIVSQYHCGSVTVGYRTAAPQRPWWPRTSFRNPPSGFLSFRLTPLCYIVLLCKPPSQKQRCAGVCGGNPGGSETRKTRNAGKRDRSCGNLTSGVTLHSHTLSPGPPLVAFRSWDMLSRVCSSPTSERASESLEICT